MRKDRSSSDTTTTAMARRCLLARQSSLGARLIQFETKVKHGAVCLRYAESKLELQSFPQTKHQQRSLAYGTNWKNAPRRRNKAPPPQRKRPEERPSASSFERSANPSVVPPALLLPTASPNVYASLYAAQHHMLAHNPPELFLPEVLNNVRRPQCRYRGTTPPPSADPNGGAATTAEVAFLGRSNVGKSSLLNALTGQSLQRVSKQPGRTQHPHYLELSHNGSGSTGRPAIGYLVDLPGYGYAVGPDPAVDAWQRRTQRVLLQRRDCDALKRVYVLVDARHGATTLDFSIMGWLEEGEFPFTLVLTKRDAISLPLTVKHVNQLCMRYHHEATASGGAEAGPVMMSPLVHVTSSKNRTGLLELWASIMEDLQCDYE